MDVGSSAPSAAVVHHHRQRVAVEREQVDCRLRLHRYQSVSGRESGSRGLARTGIDHDNLRPQRFGHFCDGYRIVPAPEDRQPW